VKCWAKTLAILAILSAPLALAEDFVTVKGKVYKDATIIRVEADGVVLRTKTGISKVYFVELPKDVQERFRPTPAKTAAAQREPVKVKEQAAPKTNRMRFLIFFAGGALLILGVVFAIVFRGFDRDQERKSE